MRTKNSENQIYTKKSKTKKQYSIIQIHQEKLVEFSNENKLKKSNLIDIEINKNLNNISILNKNINIERINNIKENSTLRFEVLRLEKENHMLNLKKNYINNIEENDYLLKTYTLLNKYIELEDRERYLLNNEHEYDQASLHETLYNINHEKNNVTDEYMIIIDSNYVISRDTITTGLECEKCNLTLIIEDGHSVCYNCGNASKTYQFPSELSYKEQQDIDHKTQFTYEKLSHLTDWLKRFQAKENKDIPEEILDKIILEASKERIKDLSLLTEEKVKKYLKKLELNEYYDNIISIINRINKRPPFVLTTEVEDKIKMMFSQIQEPFCKFKPKSRKNFLSYSYILNKFFKILGLDEFSRYFTLLKSAEKLQQQDEIFKKIVDEMSKKDPVTGWVFYPSE